MEQPELRGRPIAIYTPKQRIAEVNSQAFEAGVRVAMRVKEATSFTASLALFPRPDGMEEALTAAAKELLVISPQVAFLRDEELIVDLAPSVHLFGDEQKMLHALFQAVRKIGFSFRGCVAHSLAAARLGSRILSTGCQTGFIRLQQRQEIRFINSLTIEQLCVLPEFLNADRERGLFSHLGVKTLKEIATRSIPISALVSSDAVSSRLKDLFDRFSKYATRSRELENDLRFVREEALFEETIAFSPPVADLALLLFRLDQAFALLAGKLYRKRRLLCSMRLELVTETGDESHVQVTLARPTRESSLLLEMCRLKLDSPTSIGMDRDCFPANYGIAQCTIRVEQVCPEYRSSLDLLNLSRHSRGNIDELANRLEAGLGRPLALFKAARTDSLLPESAFRKQSACETVPACRLPPAEAEFQPEVCRSGASPPSLKLRRAFGGLPEQPVFLLAGKGPLFQGPETVEAVQPAYEFEFYDPGACIPRRHAYFRAQRNGRLLLLKEAARECYEVVGEL